MKLFALKLEIDYYSSQTATNYALSFCKNMIAKIIENYLCSDDKSDFYNKLILNLSVDSKINDSEYIKPIQKVINSSIRHGKTFKKYFTYIPLEKTLEKFYQKRPINNFKLVLYADETNFTNPIGIFLKVHLHLLIYFKRGIQT